MRIAYAISIERGGPLWHLIDLATHMAGLGEDVVVVCGGPRSAALCEAAGLSVEVLPLTSKWDVPGAARLPRALRGADVVHTHDRRTGLFGRLAARAVGAAVVHTYHGLPEDIASLTQQPGADAGLAPLRRLWLSRGYFPIEAALARMGMVIAPSRALARYLIAAGLPSENVVHIPIGVEVRRARPGPAHDPVAVGTAAVLEPRKAVHTLLSACALVRTPIHVAVYGDGPRRAELEAQARSLGLDATFHGHVDDVRRRLDSLDIFVLSSRGENLPLAILEAMSSALPVVATDVGGIAEEVADAETGFLVQPDNPEQMAAAIERLAGDAGLRRRLGATAARVAAERFDPEQVALRVREVYRRLRR